MKKTVTPLRSLCAALAALVLLLALTVPAFARSEEHTSELQSPS